MKFVVILLSGFAVLFMTASYSAAEDRPGGPLAGAPLPLYPTHHGEDPGYPGSIPSLQEQADSGSDAWSPQGQAPQLQLSEGSVENWRAYMFKYMPVRSFFDRHSQVKRWTAPKFPGVLPDQEESYAAPVYWVPRHAAPRPTGELNPAVPVVRMGTDSPEVALPLGELSPGLYVVRVIGAVESEALRPFREPLFMRMKINDGVDGEINTYRLRLGYCDEFYSVAEFYFHATERRSFQAALTVDHGSTVDLLVHRFALDDVLAGTVRRPIKSQTTVSTPARVEELDFERRNRLARDRLIWEQFPALNAQGSEVRAGYGGYGAVENVEAGTRDLTGEEIQMEFGAWKRPETIPGFEPPQGIEPDEIFLANAELELAYTFEDLRANRPLPDPYPFKDDGAGLYFPSDADTSSGRAWTPIGRAIADLYISHYNRIGKDLEEFRETGDADSAHDAAMALVRWAYAFPSLDYSEFLSNTIHASGPFGRDFSCRRRATAANFLPHYPQYVRPILYWYDALYEFIREDELLAESVGRFVPWVKTPEDVVELIDVYLVQTTAKRILRYHYHTDPMDIARLAAIVGDTDVTDPWMEWLFDRTFVYPLPTAGIQNVMVSGTTREGTEIVGSTYYAQAEGASRIAAALDVYLRAGGSPRFDLSDPERFPKPIAHAYWRIENVVGGRDFLRIGDVTGPDKAPGHTLQDLGFARAGWRWTQDPAFAFILKHYAGREGESDREWSAIERAASEQDRAPWLDNRSRVLPAWAGILEAGVKHDDPRFRRAAYVRTGFGTGHHHHDALDLQVVAHGLPMTVDGGQRPGYSEPGDRSGRVHNLVHVEGAPSYGHSWAETLADHDGARYLSARMSATEETPLRRRQVALIDVDETEDARSLPAARQVPGNHLEEVGATPESYVFDCFRVQGGGAHTYGFHGALSDEFTWNVADAVRPPEGSEEAAFLEPFKLMRERRRVGDAPETLEATWRMAVDVSGPGRGEAEMLPRHDNGAPGKFTRLHLLGAAGRRTMRAEFVCDRWDYHLTHLMIQSPEPGDDGTAFVALIEPFAGKPFIENRRTLPITGNESDARRAVAVGVTTRNGHHDVCFADGRPEQVRRIPDADLVVSGEFAFLSTDRDGFRQATLAGGTRLESPDVEIHLGTAEREATIREADYKQKRFELDRPWIHRQTGSLLEVGVEDHRTAYTATSIASDHDSATVQLKRGADFFRSEIEQIDADSNEVRCVLEPLVESIESNRSGWVASNEDQTRFWRATYLGRRRFRLDGPPLRQDDFAPENILRLWEFGVGDTVRHRTSVSVRRVKPDVYAVRGDADTRIVLRGERLHVSTDGETWRPADATPEDNESIAMEMAAERIIDRPLYLRVE